MKVLIFMLFCLTRAGVISAQNIIYVDADAQGATDGTSWTNAFQSLQSALGQAPIGAEIWIASGLYHPDFVGSASTGDRELSFKLDKSISIYGGFAGSESHLEDRDWVLNPTILSGDLLGNDEITLQPASQMREDNSRHVVEILETPINSVVVLDGIIISGGHAAETAQYGGGLYIHESGIARISNTLFVNNFADAWGGGMISWGLFKISHSEFRDNLVSICLGEIACFDGPNGQGGGLYFQHKEIINDFKIELSNLRFKNNGGWCGGAFAMGETMGAVFSGITAEGNFSNISGGAGCMNTGTALENEIWIINSKFLGNSTNGYEGGGGLYTQSSRVMIVNSLFSGNSVPENARYPFGGAILTTRQSSISLKNSTLSANTATSGCAIFSSTSTVDISNSIIWCDSGNNSPSIDDGSGPYGRIAFSIIKAPYSPNYQILEGVIQSDPLFVSEKGLDQVVGTLDDNLRLHPTSPGIDAGSVEYLPVDFGDVDSDDDFSELLPLDLAGKTRVSSSNITPPQVDIGAYEGSVSTNKELPIDAITESCNGLSVSPNPAFGNSVKIESTSRGSEGIIIANSLGQVVSRVNTENNVGARIYYANVSGLSSGLYFVVEKTGSGYVCTQSFSKIK